MADGFLQRYNEELSALRRRASRFADAFPKIAGRLRLTADVADDPHVERLIQSFAYSAARVRQKLDDEFPELTDGLLETLYPHYLAPIPSMSIVRFSPSETLNSVQTVPCHTEILTEALAGETCRFRTTQQVDVAPVQIKAAALTGQPIQAPLSPFAGAAACLRISIEPQNGRSLSETGLERLRFHIASPWRQASALYELLVNHTLGIALARHSDDQNPVFLPATSLSPVGFDTEEAMLPYPNASFAGYRLLTEFFTMPQKFLFFDINELHRWRSEKLEIFVYLDTADSKLERTVTARDLTLHATPVVNLFRQACEPVLIDGTHTEYRLLPDSRRQKTREVYAVDRVLLSGHGSDEYLCQPFFGRSQRGGSSKSCFWQVTRRFSEDDGTCDIDIAFVDRDRHIIGEVDAVASVDALCLNRNLPERLPYGGGHPYLQLANGNEAVASVEALYPPTPAVRTNDQNGRNWRLMSHLLLNHLSIFDNDGAALKDILSLYAFRDMPETRQLVDAISKVEAKASTARLKGGGMVPGTDILIEFDPAAIDRPSAFLFGCVLDRFCGLYTSVNSFTRLTATIKGQSRPVATWRARAAERPLL